MNLYLGPQPPMELLTLALLPLSKEMGQVEAPVQAPADR